MIAIDIETFDPNLHNLGDGSIRKDGYILCVGLYDGKDAVCVTPSDPRLKIWLKSSEDKIFHNGIYDLSWLVCGYGFEVNGTIHDTMTRTALIDEYADLSLDACCKKFKVKGKNADDTVEKWFESVRKTWGLHGKLWDNADLIWRTEAGRTALKSYNINDCKATFNLFIAQESYMKPYKEAYELECALWPLILMMKQNGIRIDTVALEQFTAQITRALAETEQQLQYEYGLNKSIIASPKQLTLKMGELGITSPVKTATGAQSWSADALDLIDHPVIDLIQRCKNYSALLSKYLHGAYIDCLYKGRIHCTFSPNKRDDGGTITGRFASKKPNMQNIPARDEKHGQKSYGQEMRALFLPEEGCMMGAFDYSAIEAVLLAHYARGTQAEEFRDAIRKGVDFHTFTQEMTGIKSRDVIKRMNYGFIYGMGINKLIQINQRLFRQLADEAGLGIMEFGQQLYRQYHQKLPVIKTTMLWVQDTTEHQGYIQSIGGRYHHKPRATLMNGRWVSGIYKMTNYLIQGSAAELLKRGLVDAYKEGVFNVLKLHATVHDENVVSIPYNKEGTEAAIKLKQCMEGAYKERLSVPIKAEGEVGPNWGYWKKDIWQDMQKGIFNKTL